jgi:transposase
MFRETEFSLRLSESKATKLVACVRGDKEGMEHLDVWYFPPKLPELNPVEGCWDRLNEWFKHRLIPNLSTLKQKIQQGLSTVDEPNIWKYLCP